MSSILNLHQRFTFQIASPSRLRVKIIIPLYVHKSTYFLYKIAFNHKIIVTHKLLTYQKESFFETCSTMLTVYLIEYLPVICPHLSFWVVYYLILRNLSFHDLYKLIYFHRFGFAL